MLVIDMFVAARGVRLPNLDECVPNGPSVAVKNASADDDALAQRFARMLRSQIVIFFPDFLMPVDWSRDLRQSVRQHNQRP